MMQQERQEQEIPRVSMTDEEIEAANLKTPPLLNSDIKLMDYTPEWAAAFAEEARRMSDDLGALPHRIEHTGSTSVPGLPAKPVIDILLIVPDSADESAYVPSLTPLGYALAVREPDWYEHRVLRKPDLAPSAESVNLHVLSTGCPEIRRMILFRDWLRAHTNDRDLYARTKRDLAQRTWTYMQHYADAKSEVIADILERAMRAEPSSAHGSS
ncbi:MULTISPECIES: GrpB family protein [unclassified Streptomyces]|uniref:GrpB family protein n=1 Tax=unclassified Streptomyces TaxID=2593676 RepID=UPI0038231D21